jgi:alkaline phosphatase D
MPLRSSSMPQGSALRLYNRFRFGDLATFTALDGRQYRSKQPCVLRNYRGGHVAPDSCTERLDPARTYLGMEQEQWLFGAFKQSDIAWNIIAQEQLVAALRQKDPSGVWGYWTEGWDGYPAARRRMLDAIAATRVRNPVFIGGDIHSYWTTDLKHSYWTTDLKADFENPSSATIATEFAGTSITSDPPPLALFLTIPQNPHVRYCEREYRGYVAVDLARTHMQARMQGHF